MQGHFKLLLPTNPSSDRTGDMLLMVRDELIAHPTCHRGGGSEKRRRSFVYEYLWKPSTIYFDQSNIKSSSGSYRIGFRK